jgi:hypothetical protein
MSVHARVPILIQASAQSRKVNKVSIFFIWLNIPLLNRPHIENPP